MRSDLNKYNTLTCPCCRKKRQLKEFEQLEKLNKQYVFDYLISVFESAKYGYLQWACDDCLKRGIAINGKPEKQNWGGFTYPYFAFYDQEKKCSTCEQDFIFTKQEQIYWYEQLKFIVWSKPKDCASCRKEKREPKSRNTKISNLVKNLEKDNIDQVEELIDLYLDINKVEKAKYYLALIRKNLKKEINVVLEQRLIKIKEKITMHNTI
ncbi:zinc-ribbon domain containing protein [uncultured Aquimarina sp.]|uniref:zinc-ribbon domain containing protein n=1 Tax=uncultured Aquimarina sp. TaxID=575652 RepID=UPI002612A9F5|nr:zinc-ribbon domain containing protein [uncultured Aquimarina sp.]